MGHTNKHIILDHLAQSKGLRRKDLVTFICINNGYEGHKRGYYGTTLQQWALEGYIQKKGNKWYVGNLGKTYLKSPKQATLQASINVLRKKLDRYKGYYHEAKHNANQYRVEYKEAREELDTERNEIYKLKSELGECERKRDIERTSYHESVDSIEENRVNLIKEVEELRANLSDAKELLEERGNELMEALQSKQTIAPNTLVKMPPPSTDYSEFSKAELVAIIKKIL